MVRNIILGISALLVLLSSCSRRQYCLDSVQRERLLVDERYDGAQDASVEKFIEPYRHVVDSMMSPVVGQTARYLSASRPESALSNLLADILVWGSARYNESPHFAVYNMGGIRAAFAEGDVRVGDVVDVAPFENKICFLTLSGTDVLELFSQIASVGGEAVSKGVELEIDKKGRLISARIHGKPVSPDAAYRVATIDYLAQGNDKMEAFKRGTNVNAPSGESNNVRYVIMDYFREKASEGKKVDAAVEGRIRIL